MLDQLWTSFGLIFESQTFVLMAFGTFLGIIVGATPGIGPAQLIPISLPFTFFLRPTPALMFLLAEYVGGIYGGSISAILLNTPGTPGAVATGLDGYPLAKQGKSGKALKLALYSSVFGDIFSTIVLIAGSVILANIALKFGPPETAGVIFFSLAIVASLLGKSVVRGLITVTIGLIVSTVGADPIAGTPRLLFGFYELSGGIGLVPLTMGLFAVAEVFIQAEERLTRFGEKGVLPESENPMDQKLTLSEFLQLKGALLRGAIIGTFLGMVPGEGASAAAFTSYGSAKAASKTPEKFGEGCLEGVAAPEAANNATTASGLIPFLSLGVPGTGIIAILGAGFMLHGIIPGPMIFQQHGDVVYALFIGLLIVNVFMLIEAQFGMRFFLYVLTHVPGTIVFPTVLILCVAGTYAIYLKMTDVALMFIFGIIGYVMRKLDFPLAPMLISFILAPKLETTVRQSLLISGGSVDIFFTHLIALAFFVLGTIIIVICLVYKKS